MHCNAKRTLYLSANHAPEQASQEAHRHVLTSKVLAKQLLYWFVLGALRSQRTTGCAAGRIRLPAVHHIVMPLFWQDPASPAVECSSNRSLGRMQGVLNSQYSFRRGALACQLRAALSCLVFDKTLMVSTADMAGFSGGTVQTLMSVDADRVVNMFSWMHELWSLPLQIVVALGLLYTQARP